MSEAKGVDGNAIRAAYFVDHQEPRQIAASLGVTRQTVYHHLHADDAAYLAERERRRVAAPPKGNNGSTVAPHRTSAGAWTKPRPEGPLAMGIKRAAQVREQVRRRYDLEYAGATAALLSLIQMARSVGPDDPAYLTLGQLEDLTGLRKAHIRWLLMRHETDQAVEDVATPPSTPTPTASPTSAPLPSPPPPTPSPASTPPSQDHKGDTDGN